MTPRDPYAPEESTVKKNTGSFIIREREREYTPIEPMTAIAGTTGEHKAASSSPSTGFLVTLSVILGVIIAGAALLGGLGNAFYVTRSEFTASRTDYATDKQHFQDENSSVKQVLGRFEETLSKQEATLQKIADSVQGIKVDMARRGR